MKRKSNYSSKRFHKRIVRIGVYSSSKDRITFTYINILVLVHFSYIPVTEKQTASMRLKKEKKKRYYNIYNTR